MNEYIKKLLYLYWKLITFAVRNISKGLLAGENGIGSILIGTVALLVVAVPFVLFGGLVQVLPTILPIILPIVVLCLAAGLGWKLLSNRQKGIDFKSSLLALLQFNWLKLLFRQQKKKDFWDEQDLWAWSSVKEIAATIGTQDNGRKAVLALNDAVPHVLLAGRAGSGKSNLLHVIIHELANRYSPDELEFYLMDYKDGVEFNSYGGDKASSVSGLPHARLVATESDAEYGITVLEHLQKELLRRNHLFRSNGIKNIKECSRGTLPRILVIIDEFQVLFQTSDTITAKVNALLSDLLGRGRNAGIHILLATQSVRALLGVSGFGAVKAKLNCRIALACSQEESEFILSSGNRVAGELGEENNKSSTRFGILNNDDGNLTANVRFAIPFAAPDACVGHQAFLVSQFTGIPKETKVFSGSKSPSMPSAQWFRNTQNRPTQIILGEELNFEAKMFSFDWEQYAGNNLLIAGFEEVIHTGLLRSLTFSAANHFDRIVYFSADRNFTSLGFSFPSIEVKRFDWDGNIVMIVAEMKRKKMLLIVDLLENARVFSPPNSYGSPSTPPSPAELFKQFLEEAPQCGSHVVAFAANWRRFENQCRDYLRLFELRIGFNLDEMSAGSLVGTPTGIFKGLNNSAKAIFSDLQRNEQVLFRPFIVAK
ncbi:MAG: hypothetical protein LBQ54_09895 [Planctomycetaceae bacterium]|jgi:hypothetical protein|nr:hypothetical protein [Planctomycetaceae bacterium]